MTTTEIKKDRRALLAALNIADDHRDLAHCPCRFCGSSDALSVSCKEDVWLFCCHSCGKAGSVLDASPGMAFKAVSARCGMRKTPKAFPTLSDAANALGRYWQAAKTTLWKYHDATGEKVLMAVGRFDMSGGKRYSPFSPTADGWVCRDPSGALPLYNLHELAKRPSEVVWIAEGEKAADAISKAGGVATTSAHGAKSAAKTDWRPLAGRDVILWPDADQPGAQYAADVREILFGLGVKRLRQVETEKLGLTGGQDAADYLHGECLADLLEDALSASIEIKPPGPLDELKKVLSDSTAGRRFDAGLPWDGSSRAARPMTPGTVTMLVGAPGSVKSLMLLQCVRFWVAAGYKVAALMLEDSRAFHHRRILAQMAENSSLTDDAFCRANPRVVQDAMQRHEAELSEVAKAIETMPDDTPPTAQNLAAWVELKAAGGCRIIAIDPISLMTKTARPWEDDNAFTSAAKRTIERCGASLFLVNHPRRQPPGFKTQMGLDDLSGGACFSRFTQNVFLLTKTKAEEVTVKTPMGLLRAFCNRQIVCLKNRSGTAEGTVWGAHFDGRTLNLREQGEADV